MTYLDRILTASASSSLDESVAGVDHAADTVGVGVKLSLEGLVLLVLALIVAREGTGKQTSQYHSYGSSWERWIDEVVPFSPRFGLVQIVCLR